MKKLLYRRRFAASFLVAVALGTFTLPAALVMAPPAYSAAPVPVGADLLKPVADTTAWSLDAYESGTATLLKADGEPNAARITVGGVNGVNWHVQFHPKTMDALEEGATYTLRFRAKSPESLRVDLVGQINSRDHHNIGLARDLTLTPEWKSYEYTFEASDLARNSEVNLLPNFLMGIKNGTVWLADISLVLVKTAPASPAPLPPPTANPSAVPDFGEAVFEGVRFIKIPAGTYWQGTPEADRAALQKAGLWTPQDVVEGPARSVQITKPFFLSKYEVTQAQWKAVMGEKTNPSAFKSDPNLPVENLSWMQAQDFCKALSYKNKEARFRLPTEAEWEYAARAGSDGAFGMGADKTAITPQNLGEYAWIYANAGQKTHPVGQKKPNAWGLYDMSGNVWEWCGDGYLPDAYAKAAPANPFVRPADATERVLRGGCWFLDARAQRAALRGGNLPGFKSQYVGFRLVREL